MSEHIPVNPDILRWARETAGYSIEDVVDKIKRKQVTVKVVQDWEDGNASPSYPQLEKLAYEIFKRPLALFSFPNHRKKKLQGSLFVHCLRKKLTF